VLNVDSQLGIETTVETLLKTITARAWPIDYEGALKLDRN